MFRGFSLTSDIGHGLPKFPDVPKTFLTWLDTLSDCHFWLIIYGFLLLFTVYFRWLSLSCKKNPMIGQSKMYWTAYQTLLIFFYVWLCPLFLRPKTE